MSKDVEEFEIDPRIEKVIWRSIGVKSARQVAEETGLDAERVFAIRRELMSGVDEITVQVKRQKLLVDLEDIADKTRDDYDNAPYEFKAGLMNSAVSAMKTILVELNRTAKGEQEAIDRLNQLRINELLRLIDLTVARTLNEIATEHGLDEGELLEVFQRHLKPAAEELSR